MGKKILVVDDEPFVLRSLTYILNRNGYEALPAKDGAEALEAIKKYHPDLIFLDVMMPKLTGYEVCRRIRNNPEFKDVYIIMLTAKGQERDRKKGMAFGANEYITKPFSPSKVIHRVKELLTPEE
ncbi:MAG: response regulator [Calditrichaeota bacterium]|nr:MAG: response regulator [Calditrichota bacterium]